MLCIYEATHGQCGCVVKAESLTAIEVANISDIVVRHTNARNGEYHC